MIKVAIIGRPNVGKSTLFNKLTKRNIAIVHDSSGTTRDVKEYIVKCYDGFEFALLDTAGLEKAPEGSIANRMTEKTLNAIKVADIIFFVIDGKTSVLPEDMDFAKVVKKYNKDVILVVNKSENMNNFKNNLGDFYRLGFGDPLPLSAEHGQGMINLIERLKSEIAKLEQKLHSIENNGNENFNELKNQLSSLEDAVSNIDCCSVDEVEDDEEEIEEEPIFKKVDEDEMVEIEITDKPSDLLPFELFFDWNKADVDYKFIPQIKDIAEKALKSKEIIVIQGHTDTSGTPEYNKVLSQKRAENVGKIVMNYGIPREKIVLQGVGATDPKIPTKDGVKKPENRRVVIK